MEITSFALFGWSMALASILFLISFTRRQGEQPQRELACEAMMAAQTPM